MINIRFTLPLSFLMMLFVACTNKEEQHGIEYCEIKANNCVKNNGWSWNGNSAIASCNNNSGEKDLPSFSFTPRTGGEFVFTTYQHGTGHTTLRVYVDDRLLFDSDPSNIIEGYVNLGRVNENNNVTVIGCDVRIGSIYIKHYY